MYADNYTTAAKTATATKRYVQSLRALRLCVQDARVRVQSETICASILMQVCEVDSSEDTARLERD